MFTDMKLGKFLWKTSIPGLLASGFKFVSNLFKHGFNVSSYNIPEHTVVGSVLKHGLNSPFVENLTENPIVDNVIRGATGIGLTDAQKEANAFSEQQAENQRAWEEHMSNTSVQRQISDMKAAGVNPALALGGSMSGASTPSSASPSSVSPTADPIGLLGKLMELSMLRSQRRNIDANTEKVRSETNVNVQRLSQIASETQLNISHIQGSNLDNEQKSIILKYLDENQRLLLQNMSLQGDVLASEFTKNEQLIANLSVEQQEKLQNIVESKQRVRLMISEIAVNLSQSDVNKSVVAVNSEKVNEIIATIKNIEQSTANLVKTGKLTDKDIEFYEWNHSQPVSSATPANRYSPSSRARNKIRN